MKRKISLKHSFKQYFSRMRPDAAVSNVEAEGRRGKFGAHRVSAFRVTYGSPFHISVKRRKRRTKKTVYNVVGFWSTILHGPVNTHSVHEDCKHVHVSACCLMTLQSSEESGKEEFIQGEHCSRRLHFDCNVVATSSARFS